MSQAKTVLIVDEDVKLAELLCAKTRHLGWIPIVTGTFTGAVELLKSNRFDVVLLDLTLPDSPHRKTVESIGILKALGAPRVVVMTGALVDEELTSAAIRCGASSIMSKDSEAFRHGLGAVLENSPRP